MSVSWETKRVVFSIVFAFVYMIPGGIAAARRHYRQTPIIVMNTIAGWTGVGWIVALVWSLTPRTWSLTPRTPKNGVRDPPCGSS